MCKILYPPTVNYNILYQRPNQILRALAKEGFLAYFMNHQPGLRGEYRAKKIEEVEENFFIVPPSIPLGRIKPDVYFFSYPPYRHWKDKLGTKLTIFDSIDSPTGEFESWYPEWKRSVKESDFVMAVSDILLEDCKELNESTVLVKNGVDFEHYQKKTRNPYRKLKERGFNRKKPIVGFMGAIASWVDIELIYKSCLEYPNYNFVVIGLEYNKKLVSKPSNLFFLGHKTYDELPMWIGNFDVCTIPFKDNLVTQACNPLKFWEYLATGNPVVTSNLPETKYEDVTYWASDREEYINLIGKAMDEKLKGNKGEAKRKEFAQKNSWTERVKPMIKFLEENGCSPQ